MFSLNLHFRSPRSPIIKTTTKKKRKRTTNFYFFKLPEYDTKFQLGFKLSWNTAQ